MIISFPLPKTGMYCDVRLFYICLKKHQVSVLLNEDDLHKAVNSMPKAVCACPVCPHPACSCLTGGWRCSEVHEAGLPGRAPSGRCSGWPPTGPATARGACSQPAPVQRTGEAARKREKRDINQELKPLSLSILMSLKASSKAMPVGKTVAALFRSKGIWKSAIMDMSFQRSGSWVIGGNKGKTNLLNVKSRAHLICRCITV